jgi:hypothetical protein
MDDKGIANSYSDKQEAYEEKMERKEERDQSNKSTYKGADYVEPKWSDDDD